MMLISEIKVLEVAALAKKSFETHESRFGNGFNEIREPDVEAFIESLEIPSLPEVKLRRLLYSFSNEEIRELTALMWLGRDSLENDNLANHECNYKMLYDETKPIIKDADVEYLLTRGFVLYTYLIRGLLIKRSQERLDKLA